MKLVMKYIRMENMENNNNIKNNKELLDKKLFKDKSIRDLIEEIYSNINDNNEGINELIAQLQSCIKTPNDAIVVSNTLKDLQQNITKNYETLIKLLQLTQNIILKEKEMEITQGIRFFEQDIYDELDNTI